MLLSALLSHYGRVNGVIIGENKMFLNVILSVFLGTLFGVGTVAVINYLS